MYVLPMQMICITGIAFPLLFGLIYLSQITCLYDMDIPGVVDREKVDPVTIMKFNEAYLYEGEIINTGTVLQ